MNEDILSRIARLSGLSLSEEEKVILASDMARIVPYMERITALEACSESSGDAESSCESKTSVPEAHPLREDVAVASGRTSSILQQAPMRENDMFVVPQAVE